MPDNREIIMEALLLHDKGEYADKIIKSILDKYSYLERFERSFINRVFTGTIERKLYLDYVINSFSSVKVNKQKPVIRAILRMSTYQILFMDSVPDSAAINEAVKLAKKKKFNGLSGFVNGVLRKIAKEHGNISFPDKNKEPVHYLSVMYSAPEWICEHFIKETDFDTAETILSNSLKERPVIVRTNLSKVTPEKLIDALKNEGASIEKVAASNNVKSELVRSALDGAFSIRDIDGLSSLNSFDDGLFCVQDLSSQSIFIPELVKAEKEFYEETNEKIKYILENAELIVDVCAAPGGKTCHAADLVSYLGNDKCKIISRDLTDNKVDKIDENIERCNFTNVKTEVCDALSQDKDMINKADLVIADLPCSGLGVIGRKADIKYRVNKEDLSALATLQKDILAVVSQYVKPGGMLIYSTCTVNKEENGDNAEWIMNNLPFKIVDSARQILNDSADHDGFFIARFIRQ